MLKIQKIESLSKATGSSLEELEWYSVNSSSQYHSWIEKTHGKDRTITSPNKGLKRLQTALARNVFSRLRLSESAYGWRKNISRLTILAVHQNKKVLHKSDIKDFFPSVTNKLIFRLLCQQENCSPKVASIITKIVTVNKSLPQGTPTSPVLANAVLFNFDERMQLYFSKRSAIYSRFGDDILISSNKYVSDYYVALNREIPRPLRLNPKKTYALPVKAGVVVLGATVLRGKVKVPGSKIHKLKSLLINAKSQGLESQNKNSHPNFEAHIAGRIAEIMMFDKEAGDELTNLFKEVR